MTGLRDTFRDLWGEPGAAAEAVGLAGAALQRVMNRARRLDERDARRSTPDGRVVKGIDRAVLAREIAMALRCGDQPLARELIAAGATIFGNGLVTAVGQASHELEANALRAAQEGEP